MRLYAIRQRGTSNYLPAKFSRTARGGYTHTEPQENGGPFGPRLFPTRKGAENALVAWAQGKWRSTVTQSGEFGDDISIDLEIESIPARDRLSMDIVPFDLVEVFT